MTNLPTELGEPRLRQDSLYLWTKDKPGQTLKGSFLGALLLTDTHLVFASSGGNDMFARMAKSVLRTSAAYADVDTSDIDGSGLMANGSFIVPLEEAKVAAVKRNFISWYLRITLPDGSMCAIQPKAAWGRGPTQEWEALVCRGTSELEDDIHVPSETHK